MAVLKENGGYSNRMIAEHIRIATKVIESVDKATREKWSASNRHGKEIITKLPERILREGIDPVAQLEVPMCILQFGHTCTNTHPRLFASMRR